MIRVPGRSRGTFILAALGLAVVAYLLWRQDLAAIAEAMGLIGYWIVAIVLWRLLVIGVISYGWRGLLDPGGTSSLLRFACARWIGESINSLLPAAQIGGDLVRAKLAARITGAARASGDYLPIASVVVDMTLNLLAQAGLAWLGVWHVWPTVPDRPLLAAACVAAGLPLAAIIYSQRRMPLHGFLHLFERWRGQAAAKTQDAAERISAALGTLYANPAPLALAAICHLIAGLGRAAEVWLILHLMHVQVGMLDAIMIEGVSGAVRTAAFFLPAGLGAQEGALLLVCGWIGVPSPLGLALALVKRAREIIVGAAGLSAWAYLEGRRSSPTG